MINQQNIEGIKYEILENGTIYWEFYHNLYIPNQYSDSEFIIAKPKSWNILSVLHARANAGRWPDIFMHRP